uniref:Golgi-associated, gamma adaptin ear containing, ARF binding protein 2 n=1 Tax=Xiphophorus couchianus TaxID=32473 RepID=A0A3B5MAT3_9TELE
MASDDSRDTFESWLNKATDPHNQEDRWDSIEGFYKLVIQETDGPQIALRLLAHKVQSPQEKEALQALTVLEACMNNCGKRFHSEAAKFRFLNELIKILTPKYLGTCTPQKVKDRVTEVLYGWTLWLKEEPKIQEAYNMLKKQGIVKMDPKLPDTLIMAPPPQRTTESVFDQEDKAKLLERLLKSGRPEDLETANRLIKSTMKEEQERAEKVAKRESTLAEVDSSTKQLREILEQQIVTGTSLQPSDDVKELYKRCDRLRPSLFRLASDTTDDDAALAQILAANDELTLAVNAYKDVMAKGTCNLGRSRSKSEEVTSKSSTNRREIKSYHLIDLSALDSPQIQRKADSSPQFVSSSPVFHSHLEDSFFPAPEQDFGKMSFEAFIFDDLGTKQIQQNPKSYYEELMQVKSQYNNSTRNITCSALIFTVTFCAIRSNSPTKQLPGSGSHKQPNKDFGSPLILQESRHPSPSLKDIFVPLETIRFSQLEPVTLYNTAGIHVSLHFAKDCPTGHPGVAVAVMSAVNTSALDVKDFVFQVAVPMSMLVKLQPASQTRLPPYNPLLPPPAVSQVLLLANPESRKVRLRYKLTLTHGDRRLVEAGEIETFPDWTVLTGQK